MRRSASAQRQYCPGRAAGRFRKRRGAARNWTADNGNGTYSNPLFFEEFEDPDVIRVGSDYYLAGTTMHMNPAVILMHSKDLVNWELAGYCADKLDLGAAYRLEDGNIYGKGIWAPCIRYHDGMFYVFSNVNGAGLQVFRSKSISGPGSETNFPRGTTCRCCLTTTAKSTSFPAATVRILSTSWRRTLTRLFPVSAINWSFRRVVQEWGKDITSTK